MKKNASLCIISTFLIFLSSCNSDPENHLLNVIYPSPYTVLYADQVEDSLIFSTFDSYRLSSQAEWITILGATSYEVSYDYQKRYDFTTKLAFSQNTSGKTRAGGVRIDSYEYSSFAPYYQFGFLNISHPSPVYIDRTQIVPDSVTFDLDVNFSSLQDSICFTVSRPWSLSFAQGTEHSWVSIDKSSGEAGANSVILSFTPNADTESTRSTIILLKCDEVTNSINVRQLVAEEDEVDD